MKFRQSNILALTLLASTIGIAAGSLSNKLVEPWFPDMNAAYASMLSFAIQTLAMWAVLVWLNHHQSKKEAEGTDEMKQFVASKTAATDAAIAALGKQIADGFAGIQRPQQQAQTRPRNKRKP